MYNSSGYYYSTNFNVSEEEKQKSEPQADPGAKEQTKEISILGFKVSYSKAFGIVFLILFILLFFPGIGVSSSAAKAQGKGAADEGKSSTTTKQY